MKTEYIILNDDYIEHETNREHFLSDRGTISENEFSQFRQQCQILTSYTSIRSLLYTASKNGNELSEYLDPMKLYGKYCAAKPSINKVVREANRLALNFASALRTLVEISTNEIRGDQDKKAKYEAFQRDVFDNVLGYRFWIRLRNYLVHRSMLYEGCSVTAGSVVLSVSSSSLLEWHGWNAQQREDIELLDGDNCLFTMLPTIFAAFLLVGEWASIQQGEFERASSFLSDFISRRSITGELYIGKTKSSTFNSHDLLVMHYPPIYEIQNVFSIINWRQYIAENGGFAIFDSRKRLEELIPHFDGPFD